MAKPQLVQALATGNLDGVERNGDAAALLTILGLLDTVDHQFPIVTS